MDIKGETIIRVLKPSILQYAPAFLFPLVILLGPVFMGNKVIFQAAFWLTELLILVAVIFQISFNTYYITTAKVIGVKGILNKETTVIPINEIKNIFVKQNIFQTPLGIGNLEIDTAGGDKIELSLIGIERPVSAQEFIFSLRGGQI